MSSATIVSAASLRMRTLSSALEAVPDAVIVFNRDGRILLLNQAAQTLYGFPASVAEGSIVDDLLATRHPHGLQSIRDNLAASGSWKGDVYRRSSTGAELKIGLEWTLDCDEAEFVVERSWDITRLTAIAEQARTASHRYENVFQAMAASFWELDFSEVRRMIGELIRNGVSDLAYHFHNDEKWLEEALRNTIVLDVNQKTVEIFGAESREALIGGNIISAWPSESRHLFADALLHAVRKEQRLSAETVLCRTDGSLFDALFTVCWPPGHEGNGSVLVGVIDITDRKRSEAELIAGEARYRELFQAMSMGLVHLDTRQLWRIFDRLKQQGVEDLRAYIEINPDLILEAMESTIIAEVNNAAVALYGAKCAEELVGESVKGLWSPKGIPTFLRALEAGYNFMPGFEEETEQLRVDGTPVAVRMSFNPSPTLREQGRLLVGLLNISERVAAETALAEVSKSFAHHTRLALLGELTASISHEINQPLTAIMTYGAAAKRLLERPQVDKGKLILIHDQIVADARRTAEVIARTRTMANGQGTDKTVVKLSTLVGESMKYAEHELKMNSVRLSMVFSDEQLTVAVDPVQLQQVLVNLALNAIQEMQKVPHTRRSLTFRTFAEADRIAIEVKDTGLGIPVENFHRLFDNFFTTKATGLGMGLAICKQIVEAHGGELSAHNAGDGALFRIILPAGD
ncbi:PAS domain-containing sensor histidine kinase [Rhizobium rhizophilum]|uniref:histidine kinase n=1 Tax=Rhizobium rhizophilum TaxID=1850373 RepID=A0ABY2QUW9_9HYPH|nr:PAS domain S-box protein [Rhizobium rhizophilum]THV12683.1 PAS domain S-box protein [Rhizobium rhizophilum]